MNNKKVNVLYILPGRFGIGGVQNTVMNLVHNIPKEKLNMDAVVFTNEIGYYETEFSKYGNIYRIPLKKKGNKLEKAIRIIIEPFIIYKGIKNILKKHGPYDAVHCSFLFNSAPCMLAAKKEKVKIRITHSHVNDPGKIFWFFKIKENILKKIINKNANIKLGVSKQSLEYLFGNNVTSHIILNPVIDENILNFQKYTTKKRDYISFLQVGNFSKRKNPIFSIKILNEINKIKNTNYAKLTLIGKDNHIKQIDIKEILETIDTLNLKNKVNILPPNSNVAEQMANSDIMLIPSLQEGLPIVSLEAQKMGLTCFLSDNITKEADFGLCNYLTLDAGPKYWAEKIIEYIDKNGIEKKQVDMSVYNMDKVCAEHLEIWRGNKYYNE